MQYAEDPDALDGAMAGLGLDPQEREYGRADALLTRLAELAEAASAALLRQTQRAKEEEAHRAARRSVGCQAPEEVERDQGAEEMTKKGEKGKGEEDGRRVVAEGRMGEMEEEVERLRKRLAEVLGEWEAAKGVFATALAKAEEEAAGARRDAREVQEAAEKLQEAVRKLEGQVDAEQARGRQLTERCVEEGARADQAQAECGELTEKCGKAEVRVQELEAKIAELLEQLRQLREARRKSAAAEEERQEGEGQGRKALQRGPSTVLFADSSVDLASGDDRERFRLKSDSGQAGRGPPAAAAAEGQGDGGDGRGRARASSVGRRGRKVSQSVYGRRPSEDVRTSGFDPRPVSMGDLRGHYNASEQDTTAGLDTDQVS